MIEWTSLVFNELWVLGAAVILAALAFPATRPSVEANDCGYDWPRPAFSCGFWLA